MTRHRTDLLTLTAGVLFTTLAVLFTIDATGEVDLDVRYVPAVVLIALGVAGIISGLTSSPPRAVPETADPTDSVDQPRASASARLNTSPPSGEASTTTESPSL
jgi:hypothetical protein